MHMVDSVGMSFLNWGSNYFSLPVSEILAYSQSPSAHKLLPESGTNRKGREGEKGAIYSAKAVYIL